MPKKKKYKQIAEERQELADRYFRQQEQSTALIEAIKSIKELKINNVEEIVNPIVEEYSKREEVDIDKLINSVRQEIIKQDKLNRGVVQSMIDIFRNSEERQTKLLEQIKREYGKQLSEVSRRERKKILPKENTKEFSEIANLLREIKEELKSSSRGSDNTPQRFFSATTRIHDQFADSRGERRPALVDSAGRQVVSVYAPDANTGEYKVVEGQEGEGGYELLTAAGTVEADIMTTEAGDILTSELDEYLITE